MLSMRPGCECCDRDLKADEAGAYICSFECTFCSRCAQGHLGLRCPNCGGELLPRPARPSALLSKHPASTERVYHPERHRHAE